MNFYKHKLIAGLLILLILIGIMPAVSGAGNEAERIAKSETVYVNLTHDGSVSQINVVNCFTATPGEITDYGDYSRIVNLTDTQRLMIENGLVAFNAQAPGPFYYQGKMNNNYLPWSFGFQYELDGHEIGADRLQGAQGHLKITIEIEHNYHKGNPYYKYFMDNYMLQITVPFQLDQVSNLYAPDSTGFVAGRTMTLSLALLPAQEGSFVIEADVRDFEMEPVEIVAMESNMVLAGADEIGAGIRELSGGMTQMVTGTTQLRDGTQALASGFSEIHHGLSEVRHGQKSLLQGMGDFRSGLSQFTGNLGLLKQGSEEVRDGLMATAQGSMGLSQGYIALEEGFSGLLANREQLTELAMNLAGHPDPQTRNLAQAMLMQLEGIGNLADSITVLNREFIAYSEGVNYLAQQYEEFDRGISEVCLGGESLGNGFRQLYQGYVQSQEGLDAILDGSACLETEISAIPEGVQSILDGQIEMQQGMRDAAVMLNIFASGPDKGESVSFAAPGKVIPGSVQFVIRTPYPEGNLEEVEIEEEAEEIKNVWQRLKALFSGWFQ